MNDNQNYNVREGRTTSRVLAPPGGRSTLTLGLDPQPQVRAQAKKQEAPKEPVPKEQEEPKQTTTATPAPSKNESTSKPVSSNAFAASSNMNGAQVMTGRPTSRVIKPGGGGGPTQWKLG